MSDGCERSESPRRLNSEETEEKKCTLSILVSNLVWTDTALTSIS